jgi:cysteine synthase A
LVCAAKGYPLVVTMAEPFSVERRKLMRFLGARVVITPAAARAVGMVDKAKELADKNGWFLTRQFENEANADMHSALRRARLSTTSRTRIWIIGSPATAPAAR